MKRRQFIKVTGTIVLMPGTRWDLSAADEIPPSDGYLLVDIEKCQGWDESSGYPKRKTLESLELGYVADELEKNEKLGQE